MEKFEHRGKGRLHRRGLLSPNEAFATEPESDTV